MRKCGRVRLNAWDFLILYTLLGYRGFESLHFRHKKDWLMLIPYEGSIGDNTYKLRAVGGRASMII